MRVIVLAVDLFGLPDEPSIVYDVLFQRHVPQLAT